MKLTSCAATPSPFRILHGSSSQARPGDAGLDPAFFAGHSLRDGHVTQAKRNDATDLGVMSQTHHRSAESIAGYVREADLFRHTSAWL